MRNCFITALFLALLIPSVSFAEMPREEMYVGGVGAGCTLGYVREIYGEPDDVRYFSGEGIKSISYIYSDGFSISGRVFSRDERPEEDYVVVGFKLSDPDLATPSGIRVGMSYWDDVVSKFGEGKRFISFSDELMYIYKGDRMMSFSFVLDDDDEDTIIGIHQGTDW